MFGDPAGMRIVAAQICRVPSSTIVPEPLVARENAPLLCEIHQYKSDEWTRSAWIPYTTEVYPKKGRPKWSFQLHAQKLPDDAQITNPWGELAKLQEDAIQPLKSLPAFLKKLTVGEPEEKTMLILALHRRLYHKESGEIKKLLHKAGVPLTVLSLVDQAVAACETCRSFANPSARPVVKVNSAVRFNHTVYFDLIFFDTQIVFIGVDEAIRWTILACVEFKDFTSLEAAFRRHWLSHYGPPVIFRSDRESVFASDKFAVYLARLGVQLELIKAGDQHTWMGILDRRVQMVRRLFPRLFAELAAESMSCENEDVISEIQFAMNSGYSRNGATPYSCLFGTEPFSLFPEDGEFIVPEEAHGVFYEHQIVRSKAIAAFQQALIDERIERLSTARNRTNNQMSYVPGAWVDFYRRTVSKQLEGWRGPAVVLALNGEGYITIRWQSHTLDVPVTQVRPHLLRTPNAALHNSGNPSCL
jgi:hypothetical protein